MYFCYRVDRASLIFAVECGGGDILSRLRVQDCVGDPKNPHPIPRSRQEGYPGSRRKTRRTGKCPGARPNPANSGSVFEKKYESTKNRTREMESKAKKITTMI